MKKFALAAFSFVLFESTLMAQNTFPTTGNAGIGTTTPNANLQINGGYSTNSCTSYSGQSALTILWSTPDFYCAPPGPTGNIPDAFRIVRPNYTYPPYSESPLLVLSGDGNLGIGISPSVIHRLKVQGASYLDGNTSVKGDLVLLQKNSLHIPSISANNSTKGLNIYSNTSATDGAYIEMYGKDHSDATRKGSMRFISYGSMGEGTVFLNYDPTTSNWRRTLAIMNNQSVELNGDLIIKGNNSSTPGDNEIRLSSNGFIRAREVKVDLQSIPDYVFKPEYNLMTLDDVETFINENGHLPNVKSEKEFIEEGTYSLGEMNTKLLEKVEELTLYVLQLKKEIDQLKNNNSSTQND